jgi:hypothetical protein
MEHDTTKLWTHEISYCEMIKMHIKKLEHTKNGIWLVLNYKLFNY